jgi:membrane-associated protein
MGARIYELLRVFFQHHGYWAVAGTLLLENAGVPVPGETVLLIASFLACSERQLHLPWIIVVATLACTLGDNLGYAIGHHGGRPLLRHGERYFRIRPSDLERGERLFQRYGSETIFIARFIAGMRVIAGPLAGVLRMPWRRFVLCNFLGAAVWVTVISCTGYLFGHQRHRLLHILHEVNIATLVAVGLLLLLLWLVNRKKGCR